MNNKLMLFAGECYYPKGGWEDFQGYFDSIEIAKQYVLDNYLDLLFEWMHVVANGKIVLRGQYISKKNPEWIFE